MSQRKSPRNCFWRGSTLWGRVQVKGEVHRFSLRTSNPELAGARLKEERRKLIGRLRFGEIRRTIGEVIAEWTQEIPHRVSPSTLKRYAVSLKQLEPYLDGYYLDEITKQLISDVVRKRRADGAKTATIRRDMTALSSVLRFAEAEGWTDENPALHRLQHLKERRDPIMLPELEHIHFVIERCPPMIGMMALAALHTGCRQDELVRAERRQFSTTQRQLTVIGKGNKLRTIELSDAAYDVLSSLPVNLSCRNLFWHTAIVDGRTVAAPYANIASRFAAIVRQSQKLSQQQKREFRSFRFHDLRHRFAVDYLKDGGSLYDLQHHLGHTSVKTTEIYTKFLTADEVKTVKFGRHKNEHTYNGSAEAEE